MKPSAQLALFTSAVTLLMTSHVTSADGGTPIVDVDGGGVRAKKELLFLAKIATPLREIARESEQLANLVERMVAGAAQLEARAQAQAQAQADPAGQRELAKRQGAWDMDYGWGGGRFGKRSGSSSGVSQQSGKRYDSFGIAGRFGRSVDVDADAEAH